MSFSKVNKTTGELTQVAGLTTGGEDTNFEGSLEEWNALSESEKAKYKTVDTPEGDGRSVDNVPTEDSDNLVTSGGVFDAIKAVSDDVDDISDEIADMNNVLGAKNLLPFNLADIIANNTAGTWNGKTFTQTGSTIKFTLNDDGSITVDGTANSIATATLFLYGKSSLAEENDFKGMILSGCPSGGTTNGYSLVAQGFDTSAPSSGTNYNDLGSGVTIGDKDYLRAYVRVQAGVTVDNLTFYPMIRLASITDDTYVPYSMTNREMTPYVQAISNPNLLCNPFFRLNSCGNTSGSTISQEMVLDRWKAARIVYTYNADKTITFAWNETDGAMGYLMQSIPWNAAIVGKPITISAIIDGKMHVGTAIMPDLESGETQHGVDVFTVGSITCGLWNQSGLESPSWGIQFVENAGTEHTFKAVKVEFGNFSTFDEEDIWLYDSKEDLAECQARINVDYWIKGNIYAKQYSDGNLPFAVGVPSNRNLFDNPWFTVNQRGLTTYTTGATSGSLMTVDRWAARATTKIEVLDDGIKMTNLFSNANEATWLRQGMELDLMQALVGKTLTLSLLTTSGELFKGSFKLGATNADCFGYHPIIDGKECRFRIEWSTTVVAFLFYLVNGGDALSIRAMKLEIGSISTLEKDAMPNYQQELAKCQRYFQRYARKSGQSAAYLGMYYRDSSNGNVVVDLPVSMRISPTITLTSALNVEVASGSKALSAIGSVTPNEACNKLKLTSLTMDSQTAGTVGIVTLTGSNYIDFSADL